MKLFKKILLSIVILSVVIAVVKDKFFDTTGFALSRLAKAETARMPSELVYRMYYWSVLPLGLLSFSNDHSEDDIIYSVKADTRGGLLEKFIKTSASMESQVTKNNNLPYQYNEITVYREKTKQKKILFDQASLMVTRGERKIKLKQPTYDPVGAFAYLLTLTLKKGDVYKIPLLSEDDIYIMEAKGLEEKNGILKLSIDVKRENGTSSHGANFHVWVATDRHNSPILFKSWTPVGYASVVLE